MMLLEIKDELVAMIKDSGVEVMEPVHNFNHLTETSQVKIKFAP
ncbi:MAG: hypothetical protein ACOY40_07870 [Bacillota bacterium]